MATVPSPAATVLPAPDDLLTLAEAAAAVRVAPITVRRAIDDGALRTLRFRGRIRIDRAELARYLGAASR